MSARYKVLVVGMGKRGMHHASAFHANPRFEVVGICDIDRARCEAAASDPMLLATDLVDFLVKKGMPFREAHHVVAGLVRTLAAEERGFESLTLDEWRQASPLFGEDVREAITPEAAVAARRTPQSTNPQAVAAALEGVEQWIGTLGT